MTEPIRQVEILFNEWSGSKALNIEPLPESGSYRRYFRITYEGGRILGVHNADSKENQAFVSLNRQLLKTGNRVPEIIAEDLEHHVYLEQDLGNTTLFEYLGELRKSGCDDARILDVYHKVIDAMPGLQIRSTEGMDYSHCYPRAAFDAQSMMWDMNYFKYCLLKPLKISFFEQDLEDDFVKIVNWLIDSDCNSFMFRDFQSRNIMIHEGDLYFIDFQGGRKGPMQYDLASLLYEAKTNLSEEIRQQLLGYYLEVNSKTFSWFNSERFLDYYYGFIYLRLMQAMGAYGFRGYIEHKPLFLQSLPFATKTLSWLLRNRPMNLNLKSLPGVFESLVTMPAIKNYVVRSDVFTVTVNSFSFKNSIPQDHSGNGGGFVFDCRCLDNPGRYEEYKSLTGRDQPVIDFLMNHEDVQLFKTQAFSLVDQAVDVYTRRGFSHLMVSFGCTGGQHRSVFFAEQLSAHLKSKYNIEVATLHQELEKKQNNGK
jgi:aminoglycoside/choline kinase family phosphotransferase